MNLLSLFAAVAFAAESVLSPIPDGTPVVIPALPKPDVSFGQIIAIPAGQNLLGDTISPQILGQTTEVSPTPMPTPAPLITAKKSYTIAFLGDSMIDTMGPGLPAVQEELTKLYGNTRFTLLNYGVGATNIDYGIERITNGYTYLDNPVIPLTAANPDIVVLESFGYNPFPDADGGVNRHWLALGKTVDTLRSSIPGVKIVIAATIAPHSSDVMSSDHVRVIKTYLESTTAFAKSQGYPLADAYHATLDRNSGEGILSYINPGDHIHYSDAGRTLFAGKVVAALQSVL